MAVNIRLSPEIDSLARSYCERVGISLNSLVGVALDAYLQRPQGGLPAAPAALQPEPEPVAAAPALGAASPAPRSRENPTLTAAPWVAPDPKPILSANPSKAERTKLADWHRRHPVK